MGYSSQTVFLSSEMMDRINRMSGALIAGQGMWDRQDIAKGLEIFVSDIICDITTPAPSPAPGTDALKGDLQDIINSDQGPYEKLYNIKQLIGDL